MKTELKDFLPLYIAQEVQRRGNLAGDYEVAKLVGFCKSEVEEGKLIAQVDTGDEEEHYYHEWYVEEVILFLRPLSNMKEEEGRKCFDDWDSDSPNAKDAISHGFEPNELNPEQFRYLLSRGFDLFGLIEDGLAIDKTTMK